MSKLLTQLLKNLKLKVKVHTVCTNIFANRLCAELCLSIH